MNGSRLKLSTFDQRVAWLLANPEVWYDKSTAARRMGYIRPTVKAMKKAGLFSATTYWADCRLDREFEAAVKRLQLKQTQASR